jgi:serine/threonine-protein kinase
VISEKTDLSKSWKERWTTVSDEGNGSQSKTKRVRSKIDDSPERFLKILLHQNDALRRNRMFREVACYRTLNHPSIPKIIETNVDRYEDPQYKLYLVTELIEGATLERVIEDKGPFPADIGIPLVIRLLEVVEFCHDNDTVHRDIKPDNILLKDGNRMPFFS